MLATLSWGLITNHGGGSLSEFCPFLLYASWCTVHVWCPTILPLPQKTIRENISIPVALQMASRRPQLFISNGKKMDIRKYSVWRTSVYSGAWDLSVLFVGGLLQINHLAFLFEQIVGVTPFWACCRVFTACEVTPLRDSTVLYEARSSCCEKYAMK
jgi:hypothetical protein